MVKYLERHCAFPGTPRGGGCHVEESKALPGRCLPSPHISVAAADGLLVTNTYGELDKMLKNYIWFWFCYNAIHKEKRE
jgi:hypothetical protein